MELNYRSSIQAIHSLMPKAYYMSNKDMEQIDTTVSHNDIEYPVRIRVSYADINAVIVAEVLGVELYFEANEAGGIDIRQSSGEPLEEGLIREIVRAVMIELDNNTIED